VAPRPLPAAPLVFVSQVNDLGSQAVARGAALFVSQVLDRGAQAFALGAAALSRQKKNNSEDIQRSRVNITDFIYAVAR
jgi:hypothetical protein